MLCMKHGNAKLAHDVSLLVAGTVAGTGPERAAPNQICARWANGDSIAR